MHYTDMFFLKLALTSKNGWVNHLRAFRFSLIMFRNSISLTNGFFACFVIAVKCLKHKEKVSLGTTEIFHRIPESMHLQTAFGAEISHTQV